MLGQTEIFHNRRLVLFGYGPTELLVPQSPTEEPHDFISECFIPFIEFLRNLRSLVMRWIGCSNKVHLRKASWTKVNLYATFRQVFLLDRHKGKRWNFVKSIRVVLNKFRHLLLKPTHVFNIGQILLGSRWSTTGIGTWDSSNLDKFPMHSLRSLEWGMCTYFPLHRLEWCMHQMDFYDSQCEILLFL